MVCIIGVYGLILFFACAHVWDELFSLFFSSLNMLLLELQT